jgi:hypothetical protein
MSYEYVVNVLLTNDVDGKLTAVYGRQAHHPRLVVRGVDAPVLLVPLALYYAPHLILRPVVHASLYLLRVGYEKRVLYLLEAWRA